LPQGPYSPQARLYISPAAPKVRGHTSPGQRTEPQAGPAAWVVLVGKRERAEGPIHPFMVCDTDRLKKRQQSLLRYARPVACRGIVSRLAGRAHGLGMNRAFSPCFFLPILPRPLDRPAARSVGLGWYNPAPSVLLRLTPMALRSGLHSARFVQIEILRSSRRRMVPVMTATLPPSQDSPAKPQPVPQGRHNKSPARKCRVR
jgi:hypothetical protein